MLHLFISLITALWAGLVSWPHVTNRKSDREEKAALFTPQSPQQCEDSRLLSLIVACSPECLMHEVTHFYPILQEATTRMRVGFSSSCIKEAPRIPFFKSALSLIRQVWAETLSDSITRSMKTISYQERKHLKLLVLVWQEQKIRTLFFSSLWQ